MGFRLNLKWGGLSVQSPLSTSTSSWPSSSYSCKGRDSTYFIARLSAASILYGETETLNDTSRAHICSSPPQNLDNYYLETREIKIAKSLSDGLYNEDKLAYLTSTQTTRASQFRLLMKNLNILEDMFADTNAGILEKDILKQLERLGALSFFHSCLSGIHKHSTLLNLTNEPTELIEETSVKNALVDNYLGKVVVQSGRKELRKLRRKRTLEKESGISSPLEIVSNDSRKQLKFSSGRMASRSRKRQKLARNEAEMSSGVKLVAELDKVKTTLEAETGQVASLSNWAQVVGVEKKELQKRLHYGWHCRDELLRSTRSLVLFVARNYWGFGVAFEDLIQAGHMGVLQGAERFDPSRGYKFSTYVQYWIRKSMSTLVARHARGIRIPCTLSKAINQVQKAQKSLSTSNGKYPNDCEIAKFTGLSVAKITSARKCLRVVGSIDQKIAEGINLKYLDIIADTSVKSPEESVIRQHMINDIYTLLNSLETREKQVLILRFGLGNSQCKSLEEIGRLFSVSKEWIRKIERAALTKLRNQDLSHYVHILYD